MNALEYRWQKIQQVIEERAADPSMTKIPGGKTGLIVRQIKAVGSGAGMKILREYVIDAGLLKELRAHEQQAARELSQWVNKREVTGEDGNAIEINVNDVGKESKAELLASLQSSNRQKILSELTEKELDALEFDWRFWGRPSQFAPDGNWSGWLIRAGRGFGKTRSGAEWVRERVYGGPFHKPDRRNRCGCAGRDCRRRIRAARRFPAARAARFTNHPSGESLFTPAHVVSCLVQTNRNDSVVRNATRSGPTK